MAAQPNPSGPTVGQPVSSPVARFRLYPESKHGLHLVVHVWATRAEMLEHLRELHKNPINTRKLHGSWSTYANPGRGVGEVNLYRGNHGTATASHELLHGAFAWAKRRGIRMGDLDGEDGLRAHPTEERICYAHERMVAAFMALADELELYADPE